MPRFLKPVLVLALFAGAGLLVTSGSSAAPQLPGAKLKLKLLFAKLDPEIKAAQTALATAKAKLTKALTDEVLGEAGAAEMKSINELKLSLKYVNLAIKHAGLAQKWDKGGD